MNSKKNIDKKSVFRLFVNNYFEMLTFLKDNISEDNKSFKLFYKKNQLLRKANVKFFIRKWHENITVPYYNEILKGDIEYFLNKNYDEDLKKTGNLKNELSMNDNIEYLKNVYYSLDNSLVNNLVNYVQILTKLTLIYYK
tara:strand:- start:39 stop:458 length:420 start_codon:yes stop_codon:yes gene_type:complete